MQVNELRVGNLIQDEFGKSEEIWAIDKYKVQLCSGAMYVKSIKDISGIPLTEEWLLKFGFNEWAPGNWKTSVDLNINGWAVEFNYYLPYKMLSTFTGNVPLEYVHQLQNLFFALTGTELCKS